MNRNQLHKRLKTQPSPERVALVMDTLDMSPRRLDNLRAGLSHDALTAPLGQGERSFKRDLTHLIYCAERGSHPIVQALLLDTPFLPRIHAEREWGKLMRYEAFDIEELLAYFGFRRRALMNILRGLDESQWRRGARREGVKRVESVYYSARGMCLHELEHLEDLAMKLGKSLNP